MTGSFAASSIASTSSSRVCLRASACDGSSSSIATMGFNVAQSQMRKSIDRCAILFCQVVRPGLLLLPPGNQISWRKDTCDKICPRSRTTRVKTRKKSASAGETKYWLMRTAGIAATCLREVSPKNKSKTAARHPRRCCAIVSDISDHAPYIENRRPLKPREEHVGLVTCVEPQWRRCRIGCEGSVNCSVCS
ncbi:hypothetical protein BH09PLA1_BH09PLA1_25360 [soil metagenome]